MRTAPLGASRCNSTSPDEFFVNGREVPRRHGRRTSASVRVRLRQRCWSRNGLHRFLNRLFEILIATEAGVDHLTGLVEHYDVRSRGDIVGAGRFAIAIEELVAGDSVLRDVRLHAIWRLIHRHRHADELDLISVFGVHRFEMRLELAAVRAPGRPELDEYGALPDVL